MGDLSAAVSWAPEDDILLKNAIEAGASLESLAKGAVCFSLNFSLQELQDRWSSLLYDPEMAAQASVRIVQYETELSTSNPAKSIKHFNSKGKGFSLRKRKIDSVKKLYYAMRKRVCHDPCLSADFGYVITPCSCIPVDSACVCGDLPKPSEGHQLVHRIDSATAFVNSYGDLDKRYGGGRDVHREDNHDYMFHKDHDNVAGSMPIHGKMIDESMRCCSDVCQLYGYDYIQKNSRESVRGITSLKDLSDLEDSVHLRQPLLGDQHGNGVTESKTLTDTDQDGTQQSKFSRNSMGGLQESGPFEAISHPSCSQVPSTPTLSKFGAVDSGDMLTDTHRKEQEILAISDDKEMETTNSDALACFVNIDSGVSGSDSINATIPEGEFIHSHSMNFTQNEDCDGKNGKKNFLVSAPDANKEDSHTKVVQEVISTVNPLDLSDSNPIGPIHNDGNTGDVSGTNMVPSLSGVPIPDCSIECKLNAEDSEIPCNDDVLIPAQPPSECTSTLNQNSEHNIYSVLTEPTLSENADSNHTNMVEDVQPSSASMKMEPSTSELKENMVAHTEACVSKPDIHGDNGATNAYMCTSDFDPAAEFVEEATYGLVKHEGFSDFKNLTLDMSIRMPDQMNCKFVANKPEACYDIASQNCISLHALQDMECHNIVTTLSSSDQAGVSDNENSVPNYFDLEALILDQDLIPWDQETDFIQPEVSRFQHLESRKDLARLEQGARSYMNRSIMSRGAFAIIYGKHLKYYIKDPEVTLGRETEEVHVDIDLGKEGNANKISRRQAVIKMDERGSFHIKNIGKCPIFVNGKEVPCNKRINLTSDALLAIRCMKFIFHINSDVVRQHIVRARRGSSQGENTTFDWDLKS